jgi:hypothetical protein
VTAHGAALGVGVRTRRACTRCRCVLAHDNRGVNCTPCARHLGREALLREADAEGGEPRYDVLGRASSEGTSPEAVLVADLHLGRLPKRWRAKEDLLVAVVRHRHEPPNVAAANLGVSRWTIATWRSRLLLDGASPA